MADVSLNGLSCNPEFFTDGEKMREVSSLLKHENNPLDPKEFAYSKFLDPNFPFAPGVTSTVISNRDFDGDGIPDLLTITAKTHFWVEDSRVSRIFGSSLKVQLIKGTRSQSKSMPAYSKELFNCEIPLEGNAVGLIDLGSIGFADVDHDNKLDLVVGLRTFFYHRPEISDETRLTSLVVFSHTKGPDVKKNTK